MFLTLEVLERRHIIKVLKAKKGNVTQAALTLGIDRRTLYRKLQKYQDEKNALYPGTLIRYDYVSTYPAELTVGKET